MQEVVYEKFQKEYPIDSVELCIVHAANTHNENHEKLNYDIGAAGKKQLLQLNEIEEFRN